MYFGEVRLLNEKYEIIIIFLGLPILKLKYKKYKNNSTIIIIDGGIFYKKGKIN